MADDQKTNDDDSVRRSALRRDIEHVRKRPAMYIGDTGSRGLHHVVHEIVDNSIEEFMAGEATEVRVTINADGSVTVEDNGSGIPVEHNEEFGMSSLESAFTNLKMGGKSE